MENVSAMGRNEQLRQEAFLSSMNRDIHAAFKCKQRKSRPLFTASVLFALAP